MTAVDHDFADAPPDHDTDRSGRMPPQDVPAEMAALGAQLLSKDAIGDIIGALAPRDYYRPAHETIQNAILALYGRGEPADPISVVAELRKAGPGELTRVGGAGYLHDLVQAVPSPAMGEYYAHIVHDKAVLRRLTEAGTRIAQMGYEANGDAAQVSDAAQAELYAAVETSTDQDPKPISDGMDDTFDELERRAKDTSKLQGVPTGFLDLDVLTRGLRPGRMVIVAARPACGKTTLATDFCRSASIRNGLPSLFFSLEMGADELRERVLSAEAKVGHHRMQSGELSDTDWHRLAKATPRVTAAPLFIDDSPDLTMMSIRSKCRKLKAKHGLGLVVIDYLQLLTSGLSRPESRQVEVSQISRGIKLLAKELQVPVVAVSQLNRGPEQRTDKKPQVSDLRDSGSLEQDADMVLLLHRVDVYDKESPRAGEADLIVGKHRGGATGTITLAFQGHYSRFVDMAQE